MMCTWRSGDLNAEAFDAPMKFVLEGKVMADDPIWSEGQCFSWGDARRYCGELYEYMKKRPPPLPAEENDNDDSDSDNRSWWQAFADESDARLESAIARHRERLDRMKACLRVLLQEQQASQTDEKQTSTTRRRRKLGSDTTISQCDSLVLKHLKSGTDYKASAVLAAYILRQDMGLQRGLSLSEKVSREE